MKKLIIIIFVCLPILGNCQNPKKNELTESEWRFFLKKFPTKTITFLDSLRYYKHLRDTISIELTQHFLWSDSVSIKLTNEKKDKMVFVPKSILKNKEFVYPVGSIPTIDNSYERASTKNGKDCTPFNFVFPLAKIKILTDKYLLLYSYIDKGEKIYFVTAFIIDGNYHKMGHFGFMFSCNWQFCDDSMEIIGNNAKSLSYPIQVSDKGFVLHDKMVGGYYEDNLQEQYWTVEMTEKGQFEIVKEKKMYEDKITLWSEKGYFISDKDGFANLRQKADLKSKIIGKIPTNIALEILNAKAEWWEVTTPNGLKGYIHSSRIREGKQ